MPRKNAENITFFKKSVNFSAVVVRRGGGFAHKIAQTRILRVESIELVFVVAVSSDSSLCETPRRLQNIKVFGRRNVLKNKGGQTSAVFRFKAVTHGAVPFNLLRINGAVTAALGI